MKIKIRDKVYNVNISEEGEKTRVEVNGKEFIFGEENEKEKETDSPQVPIPKKNLSKKEIIAPIDGVVSAIFVKEGDFIKRNQKVLTLSSMKMENEINSDTEARVKEVLVKAGERVRKGERLVVLL